jgi:hypothetical protein
MDSINQPLMRQMVLIAVADKLPNIWSNYAYIQIFMKTGLGTQIILRFLPQQSEGLQCLFN